MGGLIDIVRVRVYALKPQESLSFQIPVYFQHHVPRRTKVWRQNRGQLDTFELQQ